MARRDLTVRVTGQQRDQIDPHQIAQILLDLAAAKAGKDASATASNTSIDHTERERESR